MWWQFSTQSFHLLVRFKCLLDWIHFSCGCDSSLGSVRERIGFCLRVLFWGWHARCLRVYSVHSRGILTRKYRASKDTACLSFWRHAVAIFVSFCSIVHHLLSLKNALFELRLAEEWGRLRRLLLCVSTILVQVQSGRLLYISGFLFCLHLFLLVLRLWSCCIKSLGRWYRALL